MEGPTERICEAEKLDLSVLGVLSGTSVDPCPERGEVFVHDYLLCRGCVAALEVAQELLRALDDFDDRRRAP